MTAVGAHTDKGNGSGEARVGASGGELPRPRLPNAPVLAPTTRDRAPEPSDAPGTLRRPMAEQITYAIHYDDGSSLVMPFSEPLSVGDVWRDTTARWTIVRMGVAVPGEPVDVWVEPVRD
jgi:hypothetical protein